MAGYMRAHQITVDDFFYRMVHCTYLIINKSRSGEGYPPELEGIIGVIYAKFGARWIAARNAGAPLPTSLNEADKTVHVGGKSIYLDHPYLAGFGRYIKPRLELRVFDTAEYATDPVRVSVNMLNRVALPFATSAEALLREQAPSAEPMLMPPSEMSGCGES